MLNPRTASRWLTVATVAGFTYQVATWTNDAAVNLSNTDRVESVLTVRGSTGFIQAEYVTHGPYEQRLRLDRITFG